MSDKNEVRSSRLSSVTEDGDWENVHMTLTTLSLEGVELETAIVAEMYVDPARRNEFGVKLADLVEEYRG